ncbi:MAG: hypothetical protein IIB33_00700 [Chloroflexi bacterium]|nr:hypothetical protein [Chloroflexota bacterium]
MAEFFEQLVADYLTGKGYITKLNVNYRKADGKGSGSDIDVLALHGQTHEVIVGDCKAWQGGVWGDWMLDRTVTSTEWQRNHFKAIFKPEWAEGLAKQVETEFGTRKFTYMVFCAKAKGSWEQLRKLKVAGNPIEVVQLHEMIRETATRVMHKGNKSVEPTTLGRMVQLMQAADIELPQ